MKQFFNESRIGRKIRSGGCQSLTPYLEKSMTYSEYVKLIDDLLLEGKSTAAEPTYDQFYVSKVNRRRMRFVEQMPLLDAIKISARLTERSMIWLVITEGWCGDAALSIPVIENIAAECPSIETRYVLRDENVDLIDRYSTDGARAIPKLIALDVESHKVIGTWGPRPAGAQALVQRLKKQGLERIAIRQHLQNWYNDDRGLSIQSEFDQLLDTWDSGEDVGTNGVIAETLSKLGLPKNGSRRLCGRAALASAVVFGLFLVLATIFAKGQEAVQIEPFKRNTFSQIPADNAKTPETESRAIRPFKASFPDDALADLRRRIAATRFPDRETVADRSQGVRLAKFEELIRYWGTDYDWRRLEAKLNAIPQYVTRIDGIDIHFIHVRSKEKDALPIVITHGWPGSLIEQLKVIEPLVDPVKHGGKAEEAFDVVIPSIPGFGFSGRPTGAGWDPDRIARAWSELMSRLGYERYVAQGGDWGSPISSSMARQAVPGLLGIHINLPAAVPPEVAAALAAGGPPPPGLTQKELAAYEALETFFKKYRAYGLMMGTRPQTIGYALTDSPGGLAAWIYDYNDGELERRLNRDDVLDNITLYWLTNTAASAARIYWETGGRSITLAAAQRTSEISLPVAITVFPGEVYQAPESWVRRAYSNLIYFREAERGGHFAAWEQPQLFAEEIRAAFRRIRSTPGSGQPTGIRRKDLLRNDLSTPGREVRQVRVDFDPGATFPKHSHPGEEVVYMIEGLLEYEVEGRPPVTLKAGDVLFIPAGAVHRVTNVGKGNGAELATYIVDKEKPLLTVLK
jgi:quercetin dioxygenase-like cupin family protein/pimeloyl-ACP methyl ester carboxylesterase